MHSKTMTNLMAKRWQTHSNRIFLSCKSHAKNVKKRCDCDGKTMDLHLHQYLPTVVFGFAGRKCGEPAFNQAAQPTYQPVRDRTGWPPTNLMQDDCRELSIWLATRLGARFLVSHHHLLPTHPETT